MSKLCFLILILHTFFRNHQKPREKDPVILIVYPLKSCPQKEQGETEKVSTEVVPKEEPEGTTQAQMSMMTRKI